MRSGDLWRDLRRYLLCGVLAFCWALGMHTQNAAADSTLPYYNLKHWYALSYPANWIQLRVPGTEFAIVAPDLNGALTITTRPGTATGAMLTKALHGAFRPFGRPLHSPTYGTYQLHGGVAMLASAVVVTSAGRQSQITALAASHHGRLYTILLLVQDRNVASAGPDSLSLSTMVDSIALF